MTNIREIAHIAGVSPSTVSRVMNGHPQIAEATRRQVLEVANSFNYRPDRFRSGDFPEGHGLLGYITHHKLGPGATEALQGVMEQAFAEEYGMITLQPTNNPDHICQAVRTLLGMRVLGIIFAHAGAPPLPDDLLFTISSSHTHLVELAFYPVDTRIDQIRLDYRQGLYLTVEHLYNLGHRDIALFSSPSPRNNNDAIMAAACKQHGMLLADHRIVHIIEELETGISEIMALSPRPTAVIIQNGLIVMHAMYLAEQRRIRVPQELSIVGLGDCYHGYVFPQLTSVNLHYEEAGYEAFRLLCRRVHENIPPSDIIPEVITITPTLAVRGSSGPPERDLAAHRRLPKQVV